MASEAERSIERPRSLIDRRGAAEETARPKPPRIAAGPTTVVEAEEPVVAEAEVEEAATAEATPADVPAE